MNKRRVIFILFIFVVLIQIGFLFFMIRKRDNTLTHGMEFQFKIAPVDPYDPVRGRYIALSVAARQVIVPDPDEYYRNQKVYAILDIDDQGFAKIAGLHTERPMYESFLKTKISYVLGNYPSQAGTVFLDLPFRRYYMEEFEAPRAEKAYREKQKDKNIHMYITVRVKNGFGVIEGLYIDGVHIREYMK